MESFKRGELLHSVTLKYCTVVGLIQAGLLPKPPLWEFQRLLYPREESPLAAGFVPPAPQSYIVAGNKELGIEERQYDLYDLTSLEYEDNEDI
jgi:hypothetical protein